MVPAARAADLHDVDGEIRVRRRQLLDLRRGTGRAGCRPEAGTEDPGHLHEAFLAADRAGRVARLAVISRGAQQVRARVADVHDAHAAGLDVGEQRTTLQRVVDDLSLGAHPGQGTRRRRTTTRTRRRPPLR